jgi:Polysaccharide lyase
VTFTGDFETGNELQWDWGAQCQNIGTQYTLGDPNRGVLSFVTSSVAQGNYAARVDLPAASANNGCEVLHRHVTKANSDDWYGMELMLPGNWQSPSSWGMLVAQFNQYGGQLDWGPPVGIVAFGSSVNLVTQSGSCNTAANGGCQYSSGLDGTIPMTQIVPASAFQTQRWIQMIVHIRWATDSTGVVEGWSRYRGDSTWSKTVTQTGRPTLQWNASTLPNPDGAVGADKIGAYRGASSTPLSVWLDNYRIGTDFSSVAATM